MSVTNLLTHQDLLVWYQEMEKIQNVTVMFCPLMARVPGLWKPGIIPCDIDASRIQHIRLAGHCFHGSTCLPRVIDPDAVRPVFNAVWTRGTKPFIPSF